jgi:hypothetical protein
MAGPGLDLLVYLIAVVTGIAIIARSIIRLPLKKTSSGFFVINIIGSLTMLTLVYFEFKK